MTRLKKNSDFEIDPNDPWHSDILERERFADFMTSVVAGIDQPFVLGLHSPFGTGKTTFMKTWQADLNNQGFRTAYFNAWATDFSQDALSAFLISLRGQLVSERQGSVKAEEFVSLAKKTGGFLRKRALPLIAEAGARILLTPEGAEEGKAMILGLQSDSVASFVGDLAGEAFAGQEQAQKSMEDFRVGLREIVETAVATKIAPNTGAMKHKEVSPETTEAQREKIIILVDELDRCRPTYAIEVLECIKHLFSVEGLVFVLAIDDNQLKFAVESVYGVNKESEGYLRKFMDWQVSLPKPTYVQFAKYLCTAFGFVEGESEDRGKQNIRPLQIWRTFAVFSSAAELSLRQQERLMTEINLIVRSLPNLDELFLEALVAISILRFVPKAPIDRNPKSIAEWQESVSAIVGVLDGEDFDGYRNGGEEIKRKVGAWLIDAKLGRIMLQEIDGIAADFKSMSPVDQEVNRKKLHAKHMELNSPHETYSEARSLWSPLGERSVLEVIRERLDYTALYSAGD